ncbi:alkaline phosphatase D family protein [Hyalangium rubrum]|uniref:Alkaline phosphatase D family protein n=1 Tax=Hyalangium rubrum TaxID=3103134 RepID=A0ABU5HE77_9BACT|nr:alkaline phosphatase D family protein [Hyalangium sp. s54d21]MDY7231786.1 alkaline phosphatase D family protein [Hyalangium sp. s54d21]
MSNKLHRRTILQSIVAVAATTAFGCSDEETTVTQAEASRRFFPQSVASGEPRAESVVLWTRALDSEHDHGAGDSTLSLEVSTSESFGTLVLKQDGLKALADNDHAIKVKVTNLQARTTYYYRFVFEHDGERFTSPVGRTRTAPAAGDDVPVKFVFASCQDYVGRYYNAWSRLLQLEDDDVEFIVFLGDYIYETTGDPAFQSTNTLRGVSFSKPDEAILQKNGIFTYRAASSLSNYRDIYKNLRMDPVMQKVHERYPFIVMWDDHEYSDDCWGSVATYQDGRKDEKNDERRKNAERAFFEYVPIEANPNGAGEGAIDVNAEPTYPNTHIYRDFEFGKNLRLIVTDYRTYRPDHLIAEDAYPGGVVMTKEALAGTIAALPFSPEQKAQISAQFANDLFAYVNIDDSAYANHKAVLRAAYLDQATKAGLTPEEATAKANTWVQGNMALAYVNQVLAAAGQSALNISPGGKDRGMAYLHMGKLGLFDIRGTRYIVVKDTYDLYAAYRYANPAAPKASENALGDAQEAWFKGKVASANTWKIIVSSVSMTALVWDLRGKTDIPDATLRQRFYFNADQWDGFPTKKQELLGFLRQTNVSNALFISGDIHASYASVESGIPALTAPAISSGSVKELAGNAVLAAGYAQGSPLFGYVVAQMDETLKAGNPGLVYSNSDAHGFVMLEVNGTEALATYHLIPSTEVSKDYSLRAASELEAKSSSQKLRVQNGAITLA